MEKKELVLFEGLKEVQEVTKSMALPPEAVLSVLKAREAYRKLESMVEEQRKLPDEARKKLVQSKSPLTDYGLKLVDDFVAVHRIPYSCMALIEGSPYPRAEGIRLRLQADPRIFKGYRLEPLVIPNEASNNALAVVRCFAEFWNGEVYEDIGACDYKEEEDRRRTKPPFVGQIVEKAVTRAQRRVGIRALDIPTTVAEELQDWYELEEREAEAKVEERVEVETKGIANLAEFLAKCFTELQLRRGDIEAKLGMKLSDITDFDGAFETLRGAGKEAT